MGPDPWRSERLIYRAVEPSEDEDFFLAIQTDAVAYGNSNAAVNKPQGRASAAKFLKHVAEDTLLGAVVCLPAPQHDAKPIPIGCIHLDQRPPSQAHHRYSDVGIDILRPFQGQGYGSEALAWLLDWAFDSAGLHRVCIVAFEYNAGAVRLYERLGFVREGVARESVWHAGRFWDTIELGMLDREWRALRKAKAAEKRRAEEPAAS